MATPAGVPIYGAADHSAVKNKFPGLLRYARKDEGVRLLRYARKDMRTRLLRYARERRTRFILLDKI